MICGTPGSTKTLSMRNPGAREIGLGSSAAPFGHLRHAQPRLVQLARRVMAFEEALRLGMDDQLDAERLGDRCEVMSSWVGPIPPVVKT